MGFASLFSDVKANFATIKLQANNSAKACFHIFCSIPEFLSDFYKIKFATQYERFSISIMQACSFTFNWRVEVFGDGNHYVRSKNPKYIVHEET